MVHATISLPKVLNEMRKPHMRYQMILHHDNVSFQTSGETPQYLIGQNSPELTPNDFLLPTVMT